MISVAIAQKLRGMGYSFTDELNDMTNAFCSADQNDLETKLSDDMDRTYAHHGSMWLILSDRLREGSGRSRDV